MIAVLIQLIIWGTNSFDCVCWLKPAGCHRWERLASETCFKVGSGKGWCLTRRPSQKWTEDAEAEDGCFWWWTPGRTFSRLNHAHLLKTCQFHQLFLFFFSFTSLFPKKQTAWCVLGHVVTVTAASAAERPLSQWTTQPRSPAPCTYLDNKTK